MEEESNYERLPSGVKLVYSTGFHHYRCIICQKCHKKYGTKYATKKASAGTEIEILSLKDAAALFLIAVNHSITDLSVALVVHLSFFSGFIVNKFQIVFADYSYFQLGRVNKSTFRIILKIYYVIFKSNKRFAWIDFFYSIVEFKVSCEGFCLFVDVIK